MCLGIIGTGWMPKFGVHPHSLRVAGCRVRTHLASSAIGGGDDCRSIYRHILRHFHNDCRQSMASDSDVALIWLITATGGGGKCIYIIGHGDMLAEEINVATAAIKYKWITGRCGLCA